MMEKSSLISYYQELISNKENFNKLYLSNKNNTNFKIYYNIYNTNIRRLLTIETYMLSIANLIGINRKNWQKSLKTQQEIDKQKIPFLKRYNIIYFDSINNCYLWTQRGKSLFSLINSLEFESWTIEEKTLLFLVHILNLAEVKRTLAYFTETKKYFNFNELNSEIIKFVKNVKRHITELMKSNLFVLHSFFAFPNFLQLYFDASDLEKTKFQEYLIANYLKKDRKCPIYLKYKNNGPFSKRTLREEWIIFYLIINLKKLNKHEFLKQEIFAEIVILMQNILPLKNNYHNFLTYINKNIKMFLILIENAFVNSKTHQYTEMLNDGFLAGENDKSQKLWEYQPEGKIDDTYEYGRTKIKAEFTKWKPYIREFHSYTCALEAVNKCIYFKSKKTNENYLEVHHLIPRASSSLFDYSIEVPANYIPLCANCHRLLHQGIKSEREKCLKILYEKNKDNLEKSGLLFKNVEVLFKMYY